MGVADALLVMRHGSQCENNLKMVNVLASKYLGQAWRTITTNNHGKKTELRNLKVISKLRMCSPANTSGRP